MKLLECSVQNFGSYKQLSLNLRYSDLTLIYGPTGSGKSTIPDIPGWVLFGETAKDVKVDDIRSWGSKDEPVLGSLTLAHNGSYVTVIRKRGERGDNDLYWVVDDHNIRRGKDLVDSQIQLETFLGISRDSYFISSYYHEFSETANFFSSTAKQRRLLFENLTNLELADRITTRSAEAKKETKKVLEGLKSKTDVLTGKLESTYASLLNTEKSSRGWQDKQLLEVSRLKAQRVSFEFDRRHRFTTLAKAEREFRESTKAEVRTIRHKMALLGDQAEGLKSFEETLKHLQISAETCQACNQPIPKDKEQLALVVKRISEAKQAAKDFAHLKTILSFVQARQNPHSAAIEELRSGDNHFQHLIEEAESAENPFAAPRQQLQEDLERLQVNHDLVKGQTKEEEELLSALEQIQDLSTLLRGELLKRAVSEVEAETNRNLEAYFDSAINVSFGLEKADSLSVSLKKDGYDCVYKQLSKGQRAMLTLCFSVAVMKVAANNIGKHFDTLFFDEALDGLDSELKMKAFNLFADLHKIHSNVFLIDHDPGFQMMFENKIKVTMNGDHSEIEYE